MSFTMGDTVKLKQDTSVFDDIRTEFVTVFKDKYVFLYPVSDSTFFIYNIKRKAVARFAGKPESSLKRCRVVLTEKVIGEDIEIFLPF